MKFNRLFPLFLAGALLLGGCNSSGDSTGPIIPENNIQAEDLTTNPNKPNNSEIEIIIEDDTNPPEEGMVRSPLTNEWVAEEVAETRPIAVMIPNESAAIPHYNLSDASILYEANVEGRMTRLMAIYEDWENMTKIGNIRSTRTYYAYWSFEWDAFLVHYGGPYYINDLMNQQYTEHIDGVSGDDSAFYRTKDRPDPHNVYVDGIALKDRIKKKGYSTAYRALTDDSHFQFATKAKPNALTQYDAAQNATYIDMSGCYPLTRCYFEYNEEDGLYYRSQHLSGSDDAPHTDADGQQLAFKNILVQYTKQEVLDDKGYLVLQCHDDTRDGWFFTNGKGIHVTWEKKSDYSATRYYDDDGNEITLNTGKTMICVVNENDSFTFR